MFCYPNIYSKIHPLQKADLQYCCSALVFENLEKISVKEFNFSVKVSSVGPTTVLKNELFHSLFFKIFDHDCRRTILENTFRWLFLERFLREKLLILKFRQNISYHIFSDKHRAQTNKHLKASKLSKHRGPLLEEIGYLKWFENDLINYSHLKAIVFFLI